MLERHECELISAGVDGELSPREQRQLDELLAHSEEARVMNAELRSVCASIESLPEETPPADLAGTILNRVAPRSATVVPLRTRWRRAQLPLAFAAGLLVAVAVQRLLPPEPTAGELQWLSGTLAPASQRSAQLIETEGLKGRVGSGFRGKTRTLEFQLQTTEPLEIEIGLSGTGLEFGGIVPNDRGQELVAERIESTGGTVRVVGDGAAAFGLLLPATAAGDQGEEIRVAIRSGGRIRYEAMFQN